MIQANELRIGNFINTPKGLQTIFDVLCDGINTEKYHALNYEWIEPIPLTEEILLKCKGTLDGYIYNGWDDMQFFRFDEYNASMFELEIINDEFFYGNNKIEFLHDLQNCYFFHENNKKELTVNL